MNKEYFVKKVEFLCSQKGVKPTNACIAAGVGTSFMADIKLRGRVPSVEKLEKLASYLGTTVSDLIGETAPTSMTIPEYPTLALHYGQLSSDDQEEIMELIKFKIRQAAEKEKRLKKVQEGDSQDE